MSVDPPYAIRTERLLLRCWDPADAAALKDAVDSSLDHLRPWMPWAHQEPQPLEEKVALLRTFRGRFDLGQDFVYGIFTPGGEVVGGTGLHTRVGAGALEIGYWIRASEVGRGYATEVSAALTRVAFEHCGVDRVEIRVEPENDASLAVPRKLGYREEARLGRRLEPAGGGEPRDALVFTLFRSEYPGTHSAAVELEAFDAAGARLP